MYIKEIFWFIKSVIKNSIKFIKKIGFSNKIGRPFKFFFYLPLSYQWEDIINKSNQDRLENLSKKNFSRKILIAPVIGFYDSSLGIETVIAKSLQISGAEVKVLSCNFVLPASALDPAGNNKPYFKENKNKKFSFNELDLGKISNENIEKLCSILNLDELKLDRFEQSTDTKNAVDFLKSIKIEFEEQILYKGIDISEHAKSTTLRRLLRGDLDRNNKYHGAVYYRYLLACIKYIDLLERGFNEFKPESIFAIHGIYLEHGILRDFARREKIPIYIYGIPDRKSTILISVNDTYHRTYMNEKNSIWKDIHMTEKMRHKLYDYLNSKLYGGRDYINYHPNPLLDKQKILNELDIEPEKKLVSMYTNVLWDAQIFYPSSIFDGLLDWINETIKFYSKMSDVVLAIRIHPAENKGGFSTNQPLAKEIRKLYGIMPKNVRIIGPDSNISSYILSDMSDLSIVYGSNIALEIALRGNPLIIAGEAFCRGKGFSIDPSSKEEYFKILSQNEKIEGNTKDQIQLAEKYSYHWNFRRIFNFDYASTDVSGKNMTRNVLLNFDTLEDLKEGKNKGLDIVNNLLLGKSDRYFDE
tara:strand:- start:1222 stop:2973 length:1752 start_codon:yes stop_codon:yes gene_type:complete